MADKIAGENQPPNAPIIDGPPSGKVGVVYHWTFHSDDSNGDRIYYYIDWGNFNYTQTECEEPCTPVEALFAYMEQGKYTIKAKAIECTQDGLESNWSYFEVTMPRNKAIQTVLLNPDQHDSFIRDAVNDYLKWFTDEEIEEMGVIE